MPTIQSSYPENPKRLVVGQIATTRPCETSSFIVDETDGIEWGRGVKRSSTAGQCAKGCEADKFLGIAQRDITRDPQDGIDEYADAALASILTKGDIAVAAKTAVTAGKQPTIHRTTGEIGQDQTTADQTDWATSTAYAVGDTARSGNKNYIAIRAHTSANGNVADGAPNQTNATAWEEYFAYFRLDSAHFMDTGAADAIVRLYLSGDLEVTAR